MTGAEVRTVHFQIAPPLQAYLEYLERTGRTFSLAGFDLFRANYREDAATAGPTPRREDLERMR